jgi:hypothetical protein
MAFFPVRSNVRFRALLGHQHPLLSPTDPKRTGTHLGFAKTAGFMPNFGDGYSDPEIAAVVNYVTGWF